MKPLPKHPSQAPLPQGVALIIVLSVIVLLTALIVGFLIRAGTDRSTTSSYSARVSARQLGDMAVNIVQGQINEATSGTGANGITTWASQPGAVRVYDTSGSMVTLYRLYSAPALTTTNAPDVANDLPPSSWSSSPSLWVDLNAPVTIQGTTDPLNSGSAVVSYPIIDPRDPANPSTNLSIDGFYLGTGTSATHPTALNGATSVPVASGSGANPIPMPVRWLYVLKNGEVITPDSTSTGIAATFKQSGTVPTKTDPIVGRIAFWTDDETCKVNINTAAGSVSNRPDLGGNYTTNAAGKPVLLPAPWDTPRGGGIWDDVKMFANDQPVDGEYQRYPGHPASTILYNILSGLDVPMDDVAAQVTMYNTNAQTMPNAVSSPTSLFQLLPRYNDDFGSNAGTANTAASNSGTAKLPTPKANRLYASVGEFLYAAAASGTDPTQRQVNSGTLSGSAAPFTRQQIESGKFFLTAHSRAPEVNLFNTPRIAMWPIPDPNGTTQDNITTKTSVQSPYDQLIAFCCTTGSGKYPYYFVRNNRASPTADMTASTDAAIAQNVQLYSYLQNLTSATIPGFGGSFSTKYGVKNEMNQILTEMVDYIRCTNPYDHSFPSSSTLRYTTGSEVTPLQINTSGSTAGLGRIYTISEIGLQVICTADGNSPLGAYKTPVNQPAEWTSAGSAPVSPVAGSANDPLYVSNLPARQFLRTGTSASYPNGQIVCIDGVTPATPSTPISMAFPLNETLSTSGAYVGPNSATPGAYTALSPGQKKLQAMLIFEMASPMCGYDWMNADVRIKVAGSNNITIAGLNPFPATPMNSGSGANCNGDGYFDAQPGPGYTWNQGGLSTWGGLAGFHGMLQDIGVGTAKLVVGGVQAGTANVNLRFNGWSGRGFLVPSTSTNTLDTMGTVGNSYSDAFVPLGTSSYFVATPVMPYRPVSNPFTVTSTGGNMSISGNFTATLQIPTGSTNVPFQQFNVSFNNVAPAPFPNLPQWGVDYVSGANTYVSHAADWWGFDNRIGWDPYTRGVGASTAVIQPINWSSTIRNDGAPPALWSYQSTHSGTITPGTGANADVVRSVFARDGDFRLTAAKSVVNADGLTDFATEPGGSSNYLLHLLMEARQGSNANAVPGVDLGGRSILVSGGTYAPVWAPKIPSVPTTVLNGTNIQIMGDFDNAVPGSTDGPYANWPDDGNIYTSGGITPYFNGQGQVTGNSFYSYFTPNRIMPGPVMFGSLPTGVTEGITWRTLLFRPAINRPNDPTTGPKDYLLLDLFNMPVVEPYAISEPFSTAGKINMNYQIVPFTYITRDTGVRAVIGSELVARFPSANVGQIPYNPANYVKGDVYETNGNGASAAAKIAGSPRLARLPINLDEVNGTLKQFQDKFAGWDIFRSAAQICDIYLVPYDSMNTTYYSNWVSTGPPYTNADNSWYGTDFGAVGDNVRERPYGDIYTRLTTKSNTFTVHYKVQSLKNTSTDPAQWNETRGVVVGEYRGSTILERYLDPNDALIPNYSALSIGSGTAIDQFYKWRIITNDAFSP